MVIDRLSVQNFRNLESVKNVKLHPNLTVIYGKNAQGKSNIMEAIYICATGRSYRTHTDREIIRFGQKEGHTQIIVAKHPGEEIKGKIDVHLKRDGKKGVAVNHMPIRRIGDLFGVCHVVIFSPEDLNLVSMGPGERRRFLDLEICQLSGVYYYHIRQYYKILKQRNNLLKSLPHNQKLMETVFVWDKQLAACGALVIEKRQEFISKISDIAAHVHENITNGREHLKLAYKKNVETKDFFKRLQKNLDRDILLGSTGIGPHKDDFNILIDENPVKLYGSQGQKRTACISLKLAEIDLIREETKDLPVLLLDDVLSELDESRQDYLMYYVKDLQTILTCTGAEELVKKELVIKTPEEAIIYRVENGFLTTKI